MRVRLRRKMMVIRSWLLMIVTAATALLLLLRGGGVGVDAARPKRTLITWVNGIAHNAEHMVDGQTSISSLFGSQPVYFCHNPTAMTRDDDYVGYIGDLTQAGITQKLGRIITGEVDALVKHLKEALKAVGPNGLIVHIAHSQGALITSLALRQQNFTRDEMKQMEILCFGGAEVIRRSQAYPFQRCVNYYSVNDPLLMVVPVASKALRSGFLGLSSNSNGGGGNRVQNVMETNTNNNDGSVVIRNVKKSTTGSSTTTMQQQRQRQETLFTLQEEPEFVFLTPRMGDPILDHGLFSPTYLEALTWEGLRFQRLHLPLSFRLLRIVVLQSLVLTQFLSDLLLHMLLTEILWRKTILPIVWMVMKMNDNLKNGIECLIVSVFEYIIAPLLALILMIPILIQEMIMEVSSWITILREKKEESQTESTAIVHSVPS